MALRLHVVFAGRGDAFVLAEGGQNKLWLIDGGPLGRRAARGGWAPYYRYLQASVRKAATELGQPATGVTLEGVVVSHAHDDHYGGIVELFKRQLEPEYADAPTTERPLVFNGPLVTQVLDNLWRGGQGELWLQLVADEFSPGAPDPPLGPFVFGDPVAFPRMVFRRLAPPPKVPSPVRPGFGRIWTIDDSLDNKASVLNYHPGGQILFTGDSIGSKILEFIQQVGPAQPLAVFKVPHHGSLRNSQRTAAAATVPAPVWHQFALLCVLIDPDDWTRWRVPDGLQQAGAMAVAYQALVGACQARGVDPDTLQHDLEQAVEQNNALVDAGVPKPNEWVLAPGPTDALWAALLAFLAPRALIARMPGSGSKRSRGTMLEPLDRGWFSSLTDEDLLSDPYLADMAFAELKAFYDGFAAYNYVISADGSHGHPAAETIAAIAAARSPAAPTARVFVTTAASVSLERIEELAGAGWQQKIDLRALTAGSEIVLDLTVPGNATPSVPATPPPGTLLPIDPLRTTSSVGAIAQPTPSELYHQLQNAPGAKIPGRTLVADRYVLKTAADTYLALSAVGAPSLQAVPISFTVEEAWVLASRPTDFAVIGLRATPPPGWREVKLIDRGHGNWALQLWPEAAYVSKSAAQNYRTDKLTDPELAIFQFEKVAAQAVEAVIAEPAEGGALPEDEPAQSLRVFLQAAGLPSDGPLTGAEALTALVGPTAAAAAAAEVNLPVLRRILGWAADLDRSTVEWSSDAEGLLVGAARLTIAVGTPATFSIEGITETIVAGWINLARGEELEVTVGLRTADGTELDDVARVPAPGRGRPLGEYLDAVGLTDPAKQAEVTVAGLLTRMLGSQAQVESLLMSAPSFVAAAGIGTATLDLEASQVESFTSPTGGVDVRAATIVTNQAAVVAEPAGVRLTLEGLTITIEDALLPEVGVVLSAAAKIATRTTPAQTVSLQAEIELTEERPELLLSMPAGSTLAQLVALLPNTPALGNLQAPVVAQTLGSLTLTSLGLSLKQPVEDADGYAVASVFGGIDFGAWGQVLPPGFPQPPPGSVELWVFEPEDAVNRRVGFDAAITLALTSGRTLSAEVWVTPMADGSQSKAVAVWADPEQPPVTIAEALSTFGLPKFDAASLPVLGSLLDSVALEAIELELTDAAAGGTEVSTFEIALWISKAWTPLTGFSLTAGRLELGYDGTEWEGRVGATMLLGSEHAVEVDYALPTVANPGNFSFIPVLPLGLDDAVTLVGLGSLAEVPLLGPILATLSVTEVELALEKCSSTTPAIRGWSLGVVLDEIAIGPLTVNGVAVSVSRNTPAGKPAETSLWLEAELGGNAIVTIEWDSAEGKLAGGLRMVEPQTVAEMLTTLLGASAPVNALLPIVGDVVVIGAEVEFDTAGETLKAFQVELGRTLSLGPAELSSLEIVYEAGATAAAPARYALAGKVTGDQLTADIEIDCLAAPGASTVTASVKSAGSGAEALTLSGLLSIFGLGSPSVPPLQGAPDFFTLEIAEVSAELTFAGSLGLEKLAAKVRSVSSLTLVPTSPPITLEGLGLDVDYEKGAAVPVSGQIFGTLTIPTAPTVSLELRYALDKEGHGVFSGDLAVAKPPDFGGLLSQGPYDPGVGGGLPTDIGLPATIPMAQLSVKVEMATATTSTTVTVSGYAQSTDWKWESLGIQFAVEELGGEVVVVGPPAGGGAVDYRCSLFGTLSFDRFVGQAALAFGAGRHTVLTAVAAEAAMVQPGTVAGQLGGAASWGEVVPAGTGALEFGPGSRAFAFLDLTAGGFVLSGSLAGFGSAALVSHSGPGGTRSYAFLADLSSAFRFKNLWAELAVVDTYLGVRSANLAIVDYAGGVDELEKDIAAAAAAATAQGIAAPPPFADLTWLGDPETPPASLSRGAVFFADLALSTDGTLSHNLDLIAAEPAAAAITLYALIEHAEPKKSRYEGRVSDLKLLGEHLTLSGTLVYRPATEATWLEVDGSLTLVLAAAEAGHVFEGKLVLGSEEAKFKASSGGSPISIEDPFGGMFGITIEQAELAAEFDFAGETVAGKIQVGGAVAFKVGAQLPPMLAVVVFVDGRPALVAIELPGTISIDELLIGIGLPWPKGYEVLSLEKGHIYYAPAAVTIEGVAYLAGYHLAVTAKILGHAIGIDLQVDNGGVVVRTVIEGGLDFYFLQLTGYSEDGQTYSGPYLSIDTHDPVAFSIGTGVTLFGTVIASTKITYQPGPEEWLGAVTAAPTVPVIAGQKVEFSYSEEKGFRLTHLEFVSDLISWAELAEELIAASGSSACGELVGLAWDSLVTTKVNVHLSGGEATAAGMPVALAGEYEILVDGHEVASVTMPTLTFVLLTPETFELAELPSWAATMIGKNLASLAESLFKERTALAAVIGAMVGLTAAREGLAALICDGVETPNVGDAVVESVTDGLGEATQAATGIAADVESAIGGTALAEVAADVAAAAVAFGGLVALVKELGNLIDKALSWLEKELSGRKKKAEDEREAAKASLDAGNSYMEKLLTMAGAPTAAFVTGSATRVQIAWTDADRPARPGFDYEGYKGVSYEGQVSTDEKFQSGAISSIVTATGSPLTVELPALASANDAYARVRAVYGSGAKVWEGPWRLSGAPAFHTIALPAPATVTQELTDQGDTIVVTVAAVVGATGYLVTVADAAHPDTPVLSRKMQAVGSEPAVVRFATAELPDTIATGSSLTAVGIAEGDPSIHSNSAPTESTPLPTAAPPSAPTVAVESDGLHVTWPTGSGSGRHEVRVVGAGGAPLEPQPTVLSWDPGGTGCVVGVEGIADGEQVGVELRTPDPARVALWSAPPTAVTVSVLAAPPSFAAVFESPEDVLALSWGSDPRATGAEVKVTAVGGGTLEPPPTVTVASGGATISGTTIVVGTSYLVRARRVAAGMASLWSPWLTVVASLVPAPAAVTLSFDPATAVGTVRWQGTEPNATYRAILKVLPAGTVVGEQRTPATSADFDPGGPIGPETRCEASVRTQVGTSVGPGASAPGATPTLLELVAARRAQGDDDDAASTAALAFEPGLGYVELLTTLAAAGYPTAEAEAATTKRFPGSPLGPLVAALQLPARLAPILRTAGLSVAIVVRLAAKLYGAGRKPIELVIQLRLGGLEQTPLAAALPGAYPSLTVAEAEAMATAAFVAPWALGSKLHEGEVEVTMVVPDLLDAYPDLPALQAMASLNASYPVGEDSQPVGKALSEKYGEDWGPALGDLLEPHGVALAKALAAETVSRVEATSYVRAAFPNLSDEAVQEAIEAGFGPIVMSR